MQVTSLNGAQVNIAHITDWLTDYKRETSCNGVVLGLSGGKDSTVVAMFAKKVWGDNVLALIMPNGISGSKSDIDDALDIARILGIKHKVVDIGKAFDSLKYAIEVEEIKNSYGEQGYVDWSLNCPTLTRQSLTNIPPRLRMTTLYAVAQTLGYQVIGTGNLSERYIGWTTKWGDSACDFNPIGNLTCLQVIEVGKELCKEFGLPEKYIVKPPADGLTGKTDEENFGFSYSDLEVYISGEHREKSLSSETCEKIQKMFWSSAHKRSMPPIPSK